jgi:hypothetical protein
MKRKKVKRDKAFLGAIIGAVAGLAGSAIGGSISNNKAKAQLRAQQRAQNKQDTLAMAQNLSASYGNQEYVDEFNKRVTFKNGGKMKKRKCSAGTKVSIAKRFACGGRKKAEWGASDTSALISGLSRGLGNIVSASLSGNTGIVKQGDMFAGTPKEHLEKPDYITTPANNVSDNDYLYRVGGCKRRKAKCGTKKS